MSTRSSGNVRNKAGNQEVSEGFLSKTTLPSNVAFMSTARFLTYRRRQELSIAAGIGYSVQLTKRWTLRNADGSSTAATVGCASRIFSSNVVPLRDEPVKKARDGTAARSLAGKLFAQI